MGIVLRCALRFFVVLLMFFGVSCGFADPGDPGDQPASVRCPNDRAPYPFVGMYLCENLNPQCAAVASVFTWYAGDSSVDAGFERARALFVPAGWRDLHTGQQERPSTYDYMSVMPPLHMVSIWDQIHRAHHSALAYVMIDPSRYWVSVTQFEFAASQVDRDGLPVVGAHPLHTRQWLVLEGSDDTNTGFLGSTLFLMASIFTFGIHQGVLIDHGLNTKVPVTFRGRHPTFAFPAARQSLAQRWSCQGFFNG